MKSSYLSQKKMRLAVRNVLLQSALVPMTTLYSSCSLINNRIFSQFLIHHIVNPVCFLSYLSFRTTLIYWLILKERGGKVSGKLLNMLVNKQRSALKVSSELNCLPNPHLPNHLHCYMICHINLWETKKNIQIVASKMGLILSEYIILE